MQVSKNFFIVRYSGMAHFFSSHVTLDNDSHVTQHTDILNWKYLLSWRQIFLKYSIYSWTYSISKFYFCQNCDISTSSFMLLHQPHDSRCNPDLLEQVINKISFLQLSGSSSDIWCNIQKIFQFVSQKFLWYNCNRKLYCLNDTIYNWLKTAKKFWISVTYSEVFWAYHYLHSK